MRCIARRQGEPLAQVAKELEMDRTSLYRALEPMVRDEWIALSPGKDARSRTARITKRGARIIAKAGKSWHAIQNGLITRFGKNAYQSLLADLNRLANCVEAPRSDNRPV